MYTEDEVNMVLQTTVKWTNLAGAAGGLSVLHFVDGTPIATTRNVIQTFLNTIRAVMVADWEGRWEGTVRELDTATGQLLSEAYSGPISVFGTAPGEAVADATCHLLQYRSGVYIAGRQVRGRTFVPGGAAGDLEGGQWTAASTALAGSAAASYASNAASRLWSRPLYRTVGGDRVLVRPGTQHGIASSSSWVQCAVLRHRRQR